MGASRAIVHLTFVLWMMGLFTAAMVAGRNNLQAFEVRNRVIATGIFYNIVDPAPSGRGTTGPIHAAAHSRSDARWVRGDFPARQQAGGGRGPDSPPRRSPRDAARIRILPYIQRVCGEQDGTSEQHPSARLPACAEGFFVDNDIGGNPRRAALWMGSLRASFCSEPWIAAATHGGTRGPPDADHRHLQGRHPRLAKFHDGNGGGAAPTSRAAFLASHLTGSVAWPPDLPLERPRASTTLHRSCSSAYGEPVMGVGAGIRSASFGTKDAPWESATSRWVPPAVVCSRWWIPLHVRWGPVPVPWTRTLQAGRHAWPFGGKCYTPPSFGRQAAGGQQKSRDQRGLHATGRGADFITPKMPSNVNILELVVLYFCVFLYFRIMQPSVLPATYQSRQLLLWRWIDDNASIWVFGLNFLQLRQRYQQHPSVVGRFKLKQLYRPILNRRYAQSVHPGTCVFDAPENTPSWQNRLPLCFSRHCCVSFRSRDHYVSWSSVEDHYVLRLLY